MMTKIEFIHLLRARVTRDGTICVKNSTFGYFDGTNPITGKVLVAVSYPDYGSWIQLNNSCAMHCSHRKTSRSAVHL